MSLQGLVSGAECALPNNPLAQVLKHTDGDRSVQRDRVAGPSSSRLQQLPSTSTGHVSEGDISMARQFFDAGGPDMRTSGLPPNQGQMLDLARRMQMNNGTTLHAQPQMQPQAGPDLQDRWMRAEMQKHSQTAKPVSPSAWTAEFGKVINMSPVSTGQTIYSQGNAPQDGIRNAYSPSSLYQPMGMNMGMGMYGSSFPQSFSSVQDPGKGKGKARDDAFEAAFAQFATSAPPQASSARIEELSESMEELQNSMQTSSLEENKALDVDGIERLSNAADEDTAKWEAELNQLMQAQREEVELEYGQSMREAWESGLGQYDGDILPEVMEFDDEGVPVLDAYTFDTDNGYLPRDGPSCLAQAKAILENNGSLTEAALLLEAAIQNGELGDGGYESWILLGETRCMDEREEAGMRALTEGARLADANGAKGVGLLSLATAFTNEGYERGSHSMLLRWLTARFPEHAPSPEETANILRQSHWASRERVTDAFLAAARAQHAAGVIDADVQVGLGILFYTNGDFIRAQDCFGAALAVRPKDYLLWNRLGSALSNGNKPEEALGAYREALQRRPTYTRAIYNVGVACLNIGADKEAAEHFLSALWMQESSSRGDKSEQLWFTLRRALIQMGREDLANKAQAGGDVAAFRAEGFDF